MQNEQEGSISSVKGFTIINLLLIYSYTYWLLINYLLC